MRTLVFWITVKIGDQVYKAVLDTGATVSIVVSRLLQEIKTVPIRVGDERALDSLGGIYVTICLGYE